MAAINQADKAEADLNKGSGASVDSDINILLSSQSISPDDLLLSSPTPEGKLEAALCKIARLEDMDVQLRSQLEKIISQRNQLSAEKAARDIEIQHLQAQVELLEADSAGQHAADSRPSSPRESEADRLASHMDSLQADNARLQQQLEAANQEVFHLQSQLQDSQQQLEQQLPSQHQVSYPSLSGHLESQLRAQISKNEYEVARQAAQILELQGELTKVQVSFDRSAQRQTETNAQLTRQESTTSRYAASNSLLQEQVEEAQITAASQENRIKQLDSQLSGSNKSLTEARQCCAQLGDEAQQHKELAVKHTSEMEKLQTQLDESTSAASSAAALEEKLQQQLHAQQEEQSLMQRQSEETIELLQVSVSAKTSEHQSLQAEVQTLKAQAAQQQGQLQAQLQEARSLEEQLRSAASDRASLEHNLAKQADESQHQLAEQQQAFNKLQQQLDDAEAQLGQLQSHKAHEQQLSVAQQQHADRNRDAVSALEAQLSKSQAEVASLADARQQLQQQLGERTIVLGQKAHQIALLTAQLNEAKSLPDNRPAQGDTDKLEQAAIATHHASSAAAPQQQRLLDLSSASASGFQSITPVNDVSAAAKDFGRLSDDFKPKFTTEGHQPAADNPITPLQPDPAYPQRRTYTPSESPPSSGFASTAGSAPAATEHAQHGNSFVSDGQGQPVLEAKFDQVNRGEHADDGDSIVAKLLPQQKQAVLDTADDEDGGKGSIQPQLSPPQSRPATPSSPGNGHGSVTHVNTCFAKSDSDGKEEEELHEIMSRSSGSQHNGSNMAEEEQQNDEELQGLSLVSKLKRQIVTLKSALDSKSQALAEAKDASSQVQLLEERLIDSQTTLDAVRDRAKSADTDLKAALTALAQAERVMSASVYRKQVAEIVSVISGCIGTFLTAAGLTIYLLH